MVRKSLPSEQILTMLEEAPPWIGKLCAGLTPGQLRTRPEQNKWSATEVLAHLRSCSDVWGQCIMTMLSEDAPTFRAVDPRTWTKKTDYPGLEFRPSFQAFTRQRAELLEVLKPLPPEAWARTATVTGAGKPLERTVLFYAQWLARHERTHFKQFKYIAQTVQQ